MTSLAAIAGLAAGLIGAAPFLRERRKPVVDSRIRATAPGEFAELSDGVTHFQWHGPANGPILVAVHGLTTPSYVWNWMLPGLTQAGFRVLTYDLFGRGYSDRPRKRHDPEFYIHQLNDLLAHQNTSAKFSIIGYSMGGAISAIYAASHPDRVRHAILLAPAGMIHVPGVLAGLARKLPFIGDWLHMAFVGSALVRGTAAQFGDPQIVAELTDRQATEVSRRGYLRAVLSSQRHLLSAPLKSEHIRIRQSGVQIGAIWGGVDSVIPPEGKDLLAQWNHDAHQVVVEGAEHGLAFTHADEVVAAVLEMTRG